jgi:hypothetical protein
MRIVFIHKSSADRNGPERLFRRSLNVGFWRFSNVREDEQVDRSLRLSGPVTGNIVDAATHGTVEGEKWPGGRLTPEPPLVGLRRAS